MDIKGCFLADKKSITYLTDTNPANLGRFYPLQNGLFGKMKGGAGVSAVNKMRELKP